MSHKMGFTCPRIWNKLSLYISTRIHSKISSVTCQHRSLNIQMRITERIASVNLSSLILICGFVALGAINLEAQAPNSIAGQAVILYCSIIGRNRSIFCDCWLRTVSCHPPLAMIRMG